MVALKVSRTSVPTRARVLEISRWIVVRIVISSERACAIQGVKRALETALGGEFGVLREVRYE